MVTGNVRGAFAHALAFLEAHTLGVAAHTKDRHFKLRFPSSADAYAESAPISIMYRQN